MLVNKHFYCCIVARGIHSPVAWALSSGHRKEKDPSLTKSDPVRPIAPTKKPAIYTQIPRRCKVAVESLIIKVMKKDLKRLKELTRPNVSTCWGDSQLFKTPFELTINKSFIRRDLQPWYYHSSTIVYIKPQTTVHYHLILNVF